MTTDHVSHSQIVSLFLMMLVAAMSLAFFIQQRDAGGFLAWVFLFAAVLSSSGSDSPKRGLG